MPPMKGTKSWTQYSMEDLGTVDPHTPQRKEQHAHVPEATEGISACTTGSSVALFLSRGGSKRRYTGDF